MTLFGNFIEMKHASSGMTAQAWRAAFVVSLPVLMGYTTMGAAFGILLNRIGYGPWWALFMCVTILSGSLQFAAVGMIAGSMSLAETAVMSLLINIRYSVYGIALIEAFRKCGLKRFYMIFALTDETYALQVQDERPEGVDRGTFMFLIGLLDHLYWIAGGVAGAFAGSMLTFNTRGIDFAMTALFLVILTEQCMEKRNRIPAVIGAGATLGAMLAFGAANMLMPAMLLIIGILLVLRRRLDAAETGAARETEAAL
jgi:azlC family protein